MEAEVEGFEVDRGGFSRKTCLDGSFHSLDLDREPAEAEQSPEQDDIDRLGAACLKSDAGGIELVDPSGGSLELSHDIGQFGILAGADGDSGRDDLPGIQDNITRSRQIADITQAFGGFHGHQDIAFTGRDKRAFNTVAEANHTNNGAATDSHTEDLGAAAHASHRRRPICRVIQISG